MKDDTAIARKMNSLVIEAIEDGYDMLGFLVGVNYSIINAVNNGYIFDDYLEQRDLLPNLDFVAFFPETDKWEERVKAALEKKGINYDEEMKKTNNWDGELHKESQNFLDDEETFSTRELEEKIMRAISDDNTYHFKKTGFRS